MTKILILGGAGMVGRKLISRLASNPITPDQAITVCDIVTPDSPSAGVTYVEASLTDTAVLRNLVTRRPDVIFHLASIVSGEAEMDFDKGYAQNMFPVWEMLEAIRATSAESAYCPRLVFTSSIAVFGGPFPDKIDDDFLCAPQTSYGAQKLICETLISDFSRKGFVDGISIRLPTICVRPGKPNLAASSFFSGIIREPLNGQRAALPVSTSVRHWHASPRSAAGFLTHAAALDTALLGGRRALNMPGLSATVEEQIEALRKAAGQSAVALIDKVPDASIAKIVDGWPRDFAPSRALELGFQAEETFDEIVSVYLEEDMPSA
ncbi:nucleoside-diphosphate-sugar epimerase [Shimia isoporae]|uniref:Nucleoside-diphosphate-sugar epimerase n=1 Tax=Shimia isoporae TaxID=647720 RepID=A0A4R1N7U0_9RHOB|nr:D-erythronate dehydrogenase [Shimia isoporae]TCL01154.1 nucleoside-diphosphate-sugar epimerase [Shimia isoporae]